jgi:F420H(2)-dependent quinone reductase
MHVPVPLVNFFDKANQWSYAVTGGRFGGQLLKYSMLLLHTTGRKSGQKRTHTLLYLKDGENRLICASNDGQNHYPGWYWNLQDNPRARIQEGTRTYDVIAEEAQGEEYEKLWQRFLKATSLYADHRTRTTRHFPIFILKPVPAQEKAQEETSDLA